MKSKSRLPIWVAIVGGFVAASGVQILFYGAPAMLGFGSYTVPGPLYFPVVVLWLLVPAALAALVSVRLLRSGTKSVGGSVRVPAIVAVVLLALLSVCAGAFVSFNRWGT